MAAGFTPPGPPVPVYDDALENIFHDTIVGITGVDGKLVRPRWQPEPPNQPGFDVDWISFGIQTLDRDTYVFIKHDPTLNAGQGGDVFEVSEAIKVLHSFYGPNGSAVLSRYRDGLSIAQNRVALGDAAIKLTNVGGAINLPALMKEKWVKRIDLPVFFVRRVYRTFAVNTIVSASGTLDNEQYITPLSVTNP